MKPILKFINSLNTFVQFNLGENAQDNFDMLDGADAEDEWFHAQGQSSCHVIAKISNMQLNKKQLRQIITQGALLCKTNSKYAYMSDLAIIHTSVKNVKKSDVIGTVYTRCTKCKIM